MKLSFLNASDRFLSDLSDLAARRRQRRREPMGRQPEP